MRVLLSKCMALAIELAHYEDAKRSGLSGREHQIRLFAMLEALSSAKVFSWSEHTEIILYAHELLDTDFSMPEGHNSRQESVSQGENVSPTEPCPRLSHRSAKPQPTASQRFLDRFGAGDSLGAATPLPRAMKNRFSTGLLHPPAVIPSPKDAGAFCFKAVK